MSDEKVPPKGMPLIARKAILKEEMGDGDGEVPETPVAAPQILEPAVHPPAQPAPALAPNIVELMQALIAGITQANVGTAEAIRDALGHATAMARDPMPENAHDPGHSVYSHPDGDAVTPRTELRCQMYLGIFDEEGKAKPAFEIYGDTCSEKERVALNQVQPGVYRGIMRNDGATATWRVVQQSDDNGLPLRLIIAVPQMWLSQEQQMLMPGQLQFTRQLLGAETVAS